VGLLDGVKVVELGLILPGAAVGHLLADQGADVVKVERPPGGDYVRYFPEQVGDVGGQSFWHLVLNSNKRSLTLDLLRPEGREVLRELVRTADVFVTNLIADQPARLGASYDDLRAVKPDLVYCQLTGFGATGPYATLPSHGLAMSAITGQCVLAADDTGWLEQVQDPAFGGGTQCAGQPVQSGPMWAVYGVAAALWRRERTGEGAYIDVSDCEATLASAWIGLPDAINPAVIRVESTSQSMALRSARHAFYETADGKYVFVAMIEPKFWARFCSELSRPDLMEGVDEDAAAFDALDEERNAIVRTEMRSIFRSRTRDEWTEFFIANDLPCSPVNHTAELPADPQLAARGAFVDLDCAGGRTFRAARHPLRVAADPDRVPRAAPAPGQHTSEILAEMGYDRTRISALLESGTASESPSV
jgi:crotonobetainyl-CoA:carnitine CoA-transferase CaiB-like acyl-CoA transferase